MHDSLQVGRGLSTVASDSTVPVDLQEFSILERLAETEQQIGSMLASWQDPDQVVQMRRFHRLPFRRPLLLTPIDECTGEPIEDPIPVYGRNISQGGLSIEHEGPLTCRKATITLPDGGDRSETLVVRLTWCRFTRRGTYQSGGPLVKTTCRPVDRSCDMATLRSTQPET